MPEYKFKNSSWYDFIDDNFAQKVKKNISFNKEVKTINYLGNNVNLSFSDGTSVEVDKVVITSSIGVLKSSNIEFIPELPTKFYNAINSINFKYGFKLIIKFSSKFFPDAVEFKVNNGEKVIYDLGLNKPTTENILGVLIRGEEALEYTNKEPKDIVQQILEELDVVFDGKASSSYLNEFEYENWGDHQFTLGTWVESFRTKPEYLKILNESLSEKVYFAGEAIDTSRMLGVPGAILSGYSSVDKLLSE
jgi:monoamine oxidase